MRSSILITGIACLLLLTAGCARYPGGVSPSNVPLESGGYTAIGPVAASDCKVNLLGIIPISGGNTVRGAMRSALRKESNADALVDISVDYVAKWFILWTQQCTEVHAMAVRVP